MKNQCNCVTVASMKVCDAICNNENNSKDRAFTPDWLAIKSKFDNSEWCVDVEILEDNDDVSVVLEWLERCQISKEYIIEVFERVNETNVEPIYSNDCIIELIENEVAKQKINESKAVQKLGINFENYYFYINNRTNE